MVKRSAIVGTVIGFTLLVNACAKIAIPAAVDETPMRERAKTVESNGVRASIALVGDSETVRIFGIDLSRKNIDAIWLEIDNHIDKPLILLPTAIDPDYYPPLEVAHAFHKSFAADENKALDEHILKSNFPIRSLIEPGKRVSGYIFLPEVEGLRVVDIDLVGDHMSRNFSFFTSSRGFQKFKDIERRIQKSISDVAMEYLDDDAMLRSSLSQLACCVLKEPDGPSVEPLNVVFISTINSLATALGRRGYRSEALSPRYVFGRVQDFSLRKASNRYLRSQAHTVRVWRTSISYNGIPVWAGQTSTRLGGRFATRKATEKTLPMEPFVDESRDDLTQDLAYSQALVRIGYVTGAGQRRKTPEKDSAGDDLYTTDGLRVVLVLGDRPASLGAIDFFGWEMLSEYH